MVAVISQSSTGTLERWLELGIRLLELFGILAALILVILLVANLVITIWRVTFRRLIAVLPFEGSDKAATISQLFPQRWSVIEQEFRRAVEQVRMEKPMEADPHPPTDIDEQAGQPTPSRGDQPEESGDAGGKAASSRKGVPARLGPAPRLRPLEIPNEVQFISLTADPIEHELSPVALGGISVSPSVVLDTLRRIGAAAARRTIRGTVHEFGETIRISVSLTERGRASQPLEVVVHGVEGPQLIDAVDDLAIAAVRERLGMTRRRIRWNAYRASLDAYRHHLRFEWTASYEERRIALDKYEEALAIDSEDPVVNYNSGTLLYARYVEADTKQAIARFHKAEQTEDPMWRALALAGLSMAYCQLVNRYDYPQVPNSGLARDASNRAIELAPDLEEVVFAHAFSLQIADQFADAIDAYELTTRLPGDTQAERRLRSFAKNNAGWIKMTKLGDRDGAALDFARALELWPQNKMTHANLGELERTAHDLDGAIHSYEQALDLDPEYINGANELGMLYIEKARDDPARARELLKAAESWHKRALSLITGDSERQEASVRSRFAQRAEEAGFAGFPDSFSAPGARA
jgi:tetratricopeptide (TPR) repeat protein